MRPIKLYPGKSLGRGEGGKGEGWWGRCVWMGWRRVCGVGEREKVGVENVEKVDVESAGGEGAR